MARGLKWSAGAADDLSSVLDWLDYKNVERSIAFEERVHDAIKALLVHPNLERIPQDFEWRAPGRERLREILVHDYRVGYVASSRFVEILYVIHARRKMPFEPR